MAIVVIYSRCALKISSHNEFFDSTKTFSYLTQISFALSSYVIPLSLICFLYVGMLSRLWSSNAPGGGKGSKESRYGRDFSLMSKDPRARIHKKKVLIFLEKVWSFFIIFNDTKINNLLKNYICPPT